MIPTPRPPPLPDLPPVEAPSAGFVVQLFVIPAVVVAVVILVWLLFGKLAGGERDPAEYVRRLRQASGDWRSAFELASLIQNDAKLANDPHLLGELTDLLSSELKTNDNAELKVYLIKTIGAFQTLDATLGDNRKVDPIERADDGTRAGVTIRRSGWKRRPAWQSMLPGSKASSTIRGPSRRWAQAAADPETELRQVATYALGFFGGDAARQALRERLQTDENRYVRYNAAVALGRQGDPAAKETLREMLSTADLDRVIDISSATEKQNKIEAIELEALQSLQSSLSTGSSELARSLRSEIEGLTQVGTREHSQPGPVGFETITTRLLTSVDSTAGPHATVQFVRSYRTIKICGVYAGKSAVQPVTIGAGCALAMSGRCPCEFVNLL